MFPYLHSFLIVKLSEKKTFYFWSSRFYSVDHCSSGRHYCLTCSFHYVCSCSGYCFYILCNFIAEYSHIESLDDTVGALCFFGGNMKLLIRKECLHYCQKENKKISRFQSSFQIWFRQVVLRKFEIPYLEMFITTKCNLRCKHCFNLIPTLNNRLINKFKKLGVRYVYIKRS